MEGTAFKVYGKFVWPAAPDKALEGTLEFLYVASPAGPAACLRWVPRGRERDAFAPIAQAQRLPLIRDIMAALGDGSAPVQFRLDDDPAKPGKRYWGQRLVFRQAS